MKSLSLAFKLTNWCNMGCAHCLENSNADGGFNFIPPETVQKYISEFKDLDIPKMKKIVFTGGEPMGAFEMGNSKYIPGLLDITYQAGFIPIVKTNGAWGTTASPAAVLWPMVSAAKQHGKKVNLDLPLDEYHKNIEGILFILYIVMKNPEFRNFVRLSLVRQSTPAKREVFNAFLHMLERRGFKTTMAPEDQNIFISDIGDKTPYILPYSMVNTVAMGRAAQNNLPALQLAPRSVNSDSVIQINNNNTASLDLIKTTKLGNKSLKTLVSELQNIR